MLQINQKVKTPIGEGVVQGSYQTLSDDQVKVLVRIKINNDNLHLTGNPNCVTPRAFGSALFTFNSEEVTA